MSTKKWNEESTQKLIATVGTVESAGVVPAEKVREVATDMEVSERSISAKLRKLGYEVESLAKAKTSAFTEADTAALVQFVELNPLSFTYAEIAEQFNDGQFSAKQIQGKILALELTSLVKASEKVEAVRVYTEAEEAEFAEMAEAGKFIEEIADHFNKPIASIRGKALAMLTKGLINKIPVQRDLKSKAAEDPIAALGADIACMTVDQIATATGKTSRGIKTLLTRRGIAVSDYDGEKKKAKAQGKADKE